MKKFYKRPGLDMEAEYDLILNKSNTTTIEYIKNKIIVGNVDQTDPECFCGEVYRSFRNSFKIGSTVFFKPMYKEGQLKSYMKLSNNIDLIFYVPIFECCEYKGQVLNFELKNIKRITDGIYKLLFEDNVLIEDITSTFTRTVFVNSGLTKSSLLSNLLERICTNINNDTLSRSYYYFNLYIDFLYKLYTRKKIIEYLKKGYPTQLKSDDIADIIECIENVYDSDIKFTVGNINNSAEDKYLILYRKLKDKFEFSYELYENLYVNYKKIINTNKGNCLF